MGLLVVVALGVAPALADAPAPAAVSVGPDGGPAIAGVVCSVLAGADYVPGVAADGSAVAPADLASEPSPVKAETTTIELSSRLAGRFGVPPADGAYNGRAIVGYVTVKDGQAYFNGKPLANDAKTALQSACAQKR
ncbi:MAG TPA: hypothetical protein VLV50_08545 [Stellaceae bacterium]|nr:hypothetical protein [Stellaceae bacterium]